MRSVPNSLIRRAVHRGPIYNQFDSYQGFHMSTSWWEMNGGFPDPPAKTHADCKSPGCYKPAMAYSHPNIGWCEPHFIQIVRGSVRAILADEDDLHPLQRAQQGR